LHLSSPLSRLAAVCSPHGESVQIAAIACRSIIASPLCALSFSAKLSFARLLFATLLPWLSRANASRSRYLIKKKNARMASGSSPAHRDAQARTTAKTSARIAYNRASANITLLGTRHLDGRRASAHHRGLSACALRIAVAIFSQRNIIDICALRKTRRHVLAAPHRVPSTRSSRAS